MSIVRILKVSLIFVTLFASHIFATVCELAKVPKTDKIEVDLKDCYSSQAVTFSVKHKVLYHGSLTRNLKILKPQKSTHGESWVYATYDPAIAASFIATASDFDFTIIIDEVGICSIIERYENAFDLYRGVKGSIYQLPANKFLASQTTWSAEFVSPEETPVLKEQIIPDVYEFLKQLEAKGKIHLYYYPNRPPCIPADDSDIVRKAALWSKEDGSSKTAEAFLKLHPHLKDQYQVAFESLEITK